MIAELLPHQVASAAVRDDDAGAYLFPDEAAQIARAAPGRRQEFATARGCARRALAHLGIPAGPIPIGPQREPLWPPGVVGSITHCTGYRAAAVARSSDVLALGIDAELHEPLPAGVLARVSLPEERACLTAAPTGLHWDRLLFSAKESIYKCWFPLVGSWLAFEEASVSFEPALGRFRARLHAAPPKAFADALRELEGRFLVRDHLALTAVVVTR